MQCAIVDCDNEAAPRNGGLCWACDKYRQREGIEPSYRKRHPRHKDPWEMVNEARLNLDGTDELDNQAWAKAKKRFEMACRRWLAKISRRQNDVPRGTQT